MIQMILLAKNTTNRNALKIHYLQKEWLLTFTLPMGKFPLLTWYLLDTHTQKKINCTYIYKFVFLYLQLLNLIPY